MSLRHSSRSSMWSNLSRRLAVSCLACALALATFLFGCAQQGQQGATEPAPAKTDATEQEEPTTTSADTSAEDATATAGDAKQEAKDAASAKDAQADAKDAKDQAAAPNEALGKAWTKDLTKIAKDSGMKVCVSAIDLTSGATATYQSGEKMVSASMIKLAIAETFLKQVSEGKHALDDTYELKQSDIVGGTGSLGSQGAGASVTKRELVHKMISESDNVATNVLIDLCGMDAVNSEAKALGLKSTVLARHMMDTQASQEGRENYTSADDVATLLKMVHDKTFVNAEMSALMQEALEAQVDNDCISKGLPEGTVFAHKTGSLGTVRHDGGIVEGDKPYVIVALCGGDGFSEQGAMETMRQIGEASYEDMQAS